MNIRKIISAVLSAVITMTAAVFPESVCVTGRAEVTTVQGTAYSEEMQYGDYLTYCQTDADNDGVYEFIKINTCDKSAVSVEIPAEIDGLPVSEIGTGGFSLCESLKEITIPDSVISIRTGAFRECKSLESISLPASVEFLGSGLFGGCTGLKEINIPESSRLYSAADGVLFNKDKTILIQYPAGSDREEYVIPDTVEEICLNTGSSDGAFCGCANLKKVVIPESVTCIGNGAFDRCSLLEEITIPASVEEIHSCAFRFCTALESITIENAECYIAGDEQTICSEYITEKDETVFNGVIYGFKGSTAQAYAEKYGYRFEVSSGDMLNETTEPSVTTELSPSETITQPVLTTETTSSALSETLKGDISGNGKIDLYDAIEIAKSLLGKRTFTEEEKKIADFNGDGKVNLYDAIDIAKYLLKNVNV